ncbi:MAG: RHH-type transcriptional regulator, proline utilization regulon repressor / proline dehydrogenase [Solirubrobacteraceae bacterium]|jgi:RHH-type proline utilization regulon transcriptional repressor/proline dehydrogenase/delta 1-pyrroline-5-carboxylate dehydrogenase|nr:RHH-type transcriptional regulator, proline utilization regulon repressor / proline dehydrogenase [Solirubrobacteraceae bacterium]
MTLSPFANEPVLELRRAPVRESLGAALAAVDARLPLRVPVLVGEERRGPGNAGSGHAGSGETGSGEAGSGESAVVVSTDPGAPERVVAVAALAGESDVDAALEAAQRGLREWSARPAPDRAAVLVGAAALLRERRLELAALAVRECAKPWPEADADVCEAIDFLEYYARQAMELERGPELLQVPGEQNRMRYAPRGVVAVIAPWNFPLAIPLGMTAAALATGNAAILKPAEQSPGCALELVRALREAGVPPDALALLPGEGDAGAALVRHPGVHTIAFTGSAAVGLGIVAQAAQPAPGQGHLKRVIAEMGGKNCVLVDSDADLDEAVPAIVTSAFVYAGQKCSAASRVLVHEAVADALLERVAGAVEVLVVGQADVLGTDVPPVIEAAAQQRIEGYADRAATDGTLVARRDVPAEKGWFVAPTVVSDLPPGHPVLEEEVFGPLLAVQRVRDMEEACDVVDDLPFALTGGLFARNPTTIEIVTRRSPVGNLYVNRAITGAMVGRQPFGGNRLSGTGTKAGGPGYVEQFTEPRVVTENTVRHGLVG